REENFAGQFFSNLGPYKMTGRGNVLALNELRAGTYDQVERAWRRTGWLNSVFAREGDLDALANYVNRVTGRGTLGPIENSWVADVLGFGLFSPRYLASRPQAVLNMFNWQHPRVAIEAIKDFGA